MLNLKFTFMFRSMIHFASLFARLLRLLFSERVSRLLIQITSVFTFNSLSDFGREERNHTPPKSPSRLTASLFPLNTLSFYVLPIRSYSKAQATTFFIIIQQLSG